jgi:SAM-dependent methyltransferase
VATADDHAETSALARNRAVWRSVNAQFTDADADERWAAPEITWGLFRHPEREVRVLGSIEGCDVLEIGCGTAYMSAWLARAGARPVAIDLSGEQLRTAARCQDRYRIRFPVAEADGQRLPFAAGSFDLVVSEYGAGPWCDPARWLPEAARVLRPGGRLVFLTNSVLAALCVPAEGGPAGDRLLRSASELRPVTWPGGGVEHHPGHGDWIRELVGAGFVVDQLRELHPPEGAAAPEFYEIVSPEWAGRWPAEDLWVAHLDRASRAG